MDIRVKSAIITMFDYAKRYWQNEADGGIDGEFISNIENDINECKKLLEEEENTHNA